MSPEPTTLYIRGLDPATVAGIHRAARARGMTLAAYLTALYRLHGVTKGLAGTGAYGKDLDIVLDGLGLQEVRA